jgi:hypothetical protein
MNGIDSFPLLPDYISIRKSISREKCGILPKGPNNLWVADFISEFIGYTPSRITITHNTSNLGLKPTVF